MVCEWCISLVALTAKLRDVYVTNAQPENDQHQNSKDMKMRQDIILSDVGTFSTANIPYAM